LPNNNERCYSNFSPTFREVNTPWIRKKKQYQSILVGISLTQPHAGLFFSEFIWAAKVKCRMMPNWAHYLTDDCWPRVNSCVSLFLKFKKVMSSQIKREKQEECEDFSWSQRYLIYITLLCSLNKIVLQEKSNICIYPDLDCLLSSF
jgi:hypothetical protein